MLFCKLDDSFSCNSSIIATADAAFNSFQFEARGPIASGQQRSIVDALYAWKPGQSTLQKLGVKACGHALAPKTGHKLASITHHTRRSIWYKILCSYSTHHTARSGHFKLLLAVRHF